jgi:multidrug efflux pump
MMCSKLVRHHEERRSPWSRKAGAFIDGMIARYGTMLTWVLDHQKLTLVVAVGTFVLTALLYVVIPKGFFPVQDTGLIQLITEGPQSASYEAMVDRQQAVAAVVLKDPDVESLSSFVGVDGTNTTLNSGRMLINLKPRDKRRHASGIIRRLQGAPGPGPRHLAPTCSRSRT